MSARWVWILGSLAIGAIACSLAALLYVRELDKRLVCLVALAECRLSMKGASNDGR